MYGCLCSCGSSEVIEGAILEKNKVMRELSKSVDTEMDINCDIENMASDPTSTYSCDEICDTVYVGEEDDIENRLNDEKREKLVRMFRDNDILSVYHAGAMQWSPHHDRGAVELVKMKKLYDVLVNKNMWLLVFDKMCAGFLVEENVLRRIDYFNEFIQNDMIMDKTDDEVKNFGAYMVMGEEPLGASIYIARLDAEPYQLLLKNLTAECVNDTLKVIRDSCEMTDYTYSKLDKDFMSTFFGFTSDTDLCVSFQKYMSQKGD